MLLDYKLFEIIISYDFRDLKAIIFNANCLPTSEKSEFCGIVTRSCVNIIIGHCVGRYSKPEEYTYCTLAKECPPPTFGPISWKGSKFTEMRTSTGVRFALMECTCGVWESLLQVLWISEVRNFMLYFIEDRSQVEYSIKFLDHKQDWSKYNIPLVLSSDNSQPTPSLASYKERK